MKKLKEILIYIFVGILPIIFLSMVFITFSIFYIDEQTNISLYNNGIHEEDGGKWELISVHKGNVYYYCCNECGNIIHFSDTNN
jgi:hypothetical protein